MRVFLDTNVLVSAYTARGMCADLMRLILAEHELMTGEVNLVEFRRVLGTKFRAPKALVDAAVADLRAGTIVPKPPTPSALTVRDPDDGWVLASAVTGMADMLVTGDHDLLCVADQSPIPIVDPRGGWTQLRTPG